MASTILTVSLPKDLAFWLKGYATARKVSVSRVVAELLVEKRAELKTLARESKGIQRWFSKNR